MLYFSCGAYYVVLPLLLPLLRSILCCTASPANHTMWFCAGHGPLGKGRIMTSCSGYSQDMLKAPCVLCGKDLAALGAPGTPGLQGFRGSTPCFRGHRRSTPDPGTAIHPRMLGPMKVMNTYGMDGKRFQQRNGPPHHVIARTPGHTLSIP